MTGLVPKPRARVIVDYDTLSRPCYVVQMESVFLFSENERVKAAALAAYINSLLDARRGASE